MRGIIAVTLLNAALLSAGCGWGAQTQDVTIDVKPARVEALTFVTPAGTNRNRPVRATLTRTSDATAILQLLSTENAAWFQRERPQFTNDFPESITDDFEVVPGTVVGPIPIAGDERLTNILFCETEGAAGAVAIEDDGMVTIKVAEEGCSIESAEPAPSRGGWFGWFN